MAAKHVSLWLTGGLLTLLAGIFLHSTILGVWLVLVSATIFGWVVGSLVHPWLGERVHYRVRYHAPDADSLQAAVIGQGLAALGRQGGAIALIWRREQGELTLFIEVPATLDEALRGILPRLLPGARLEVVPTPPPLSGTAGAYRCPITRFADPGQLEAHDPFNFTHLLSDGVLTGNLELRVHMLAEGATIVVQGTPGREATAAGLRPLWPLFSRYAVRRSGASPRSSEAARKQGRIRLLRPQTSSSRPPWSALLFRHYSLIDAGSYSQVQSACLPAMYFPATVGSGTLRLSSIEGSVVSLPIGYSFHDQEGAILLGVSTADGRRVMPEEPSAGTSHYLVLGEPAAQREATISMVIEQVVGLGGGLLLLDPSDDGARQMAAQLPPTSRHRRGWIDMENPAGSIRVNLLSVPPVEGRANSAASEAAALVSAIEDQIPLLDAYLAELGVSNWANRGGSNLLVDWARVLLLAHHRARLVGDRQRIAEAPVPDLQTLYELLSEPEALPCFVTQERAEWASPAQALTTQLSRASADGVEARRVAQETLRAIEDRLSHMGAAYRGLLAAGLRDQLRPALHHPSLSRLWRGPFTAPAELLGRNPGPVLLARLPLPLSGAAPADGAAARWYGSYIVACTVAAARWRLRSGQSSSSSSPPVLIVVQDASAWLTGNMLHSHLDELGRAGIALLASTPELPGAEEGAWLLDNSGTWWLHNLSSNDSVVLSRRLRNLGVQADLSLSNLPSGVAVLKFPTQQGPTVATVYTGKSYLHDTDPAPLSRETQHGVAGRLHGHAARESSINDVADLSVKSDLRRVER